MDNTQFRRLVMETPTASKAKETPMGLKLQSGDAPPVLGSRMRSNIPMTPYQDPTPPFLLSQVTGLLVYRLY